jgi:hypothetical protein
MKTSRANIECLALLQMLFRLKQTPIEKWDAEVGSELFAILSPFLDDAIRYK